MWFRNHLSTNWSHQSATLVPFHAVLGTTNHPDGWGIKVAFWFDLGTIWSPIGPIRQLWCLFMLLQATTSTHRWFQVLRRPPNVMWTTSDPQSIPSDLFGAISCSFSTHKHLLRSTNKKETRGTYWSRFQATDGWVSRSWTILWSRNSRTIWWHHQHWKIPSSWQKNSVCCLLVSQQCHHCQNGAWWNCQINGRGVPRSVLISHRKRIQTKAQCYGQSLQ